MFKRTHKVKKVPQTEPLAVGSSADGIFLLRREISVRGKHALLLSKSTDGISFSGKPHALSLVHRSGIADDPALCSDFRFGNRTDALVLTYLYHGKKGTTLHSAVSEEGKEWLVEGSFEDVPAPATMSVGTGEGGTVLYFGANVVRAAVSSKNFKRWTIEEPETVPSARFADGKRVTLIGAAPLGKNIALFYGIGVRHDIVTDVGLHNQKVGEESSVKIGVAVFSGNTPSHLLWQSESPLREIPVPAGDSVTLLGLVPFFPKHKVGKFRLYLAEASGEIGFVEFSQALVLDHRDRTLALHRSVLNPILSPRVERWESGGVFNPTAVFIGGKVHLLYRAVGSDGYSYIGYASSRDGLHIDERPHTPVYSPHMSFERFGGEGEESSVVHSHSHSQGQGISLHLFHSGGGWGGGCEDPKATLIGDRIYMTYVASMGYWPTRTALTSISVDDFLAKRWRWRRPMLMSPPGVGSKSVVLLPEKVNGEYVIFHRIWPDIIVDSVPELVFGDGTRWLGNKGSICPRYSFWDSQKISMGAAPIKTKAGWLAVYSAVDRLDSSRYKIGAMLLSLHDPRTVIARTRAPILSPDTWYENDGKPGVVYPGGVVEKDGVLYVYYGGADKVTCVATVSLEELLTELLKYPEVSYTPKSVKI